MTTSFVCVEEGVRSKRVRADRGGAREPAQALDAPEPDALAPVAPAPSSFLSPSVKEYLELGMAIPGCGWESLMKNVTLGNVTMSHRTRERPAECLASLSHSTMIGLPRAQH
ncbi:hypothetical protein EVAR_3024_1 [Eumeta japonica]|uniref:Uncharacterized protein n=1 Tax=Eumeta variegata TaxID=151549 RepID=A0A4C1SWW3_EUMVA|nr:hypothetical protein EVAR_3024_1 [Eumeta japonica]